MASDGVFTVKGEFKVTDDMKEYYEENGYFMVKGFLDDEERSQIWKVLDEEKGILKHSYTTTEPDGKKIRRVVYQHPGSDVTGMVARSEKVAGACEETTEPDGKKIRRVMYQHPGNDVTGMIARSEKVAGACEEILGGEVYHYHSKFILKDPREGGSHVWHQDYGYWYELGNIFPDMITVWMALDKTTRQNSCMQSAHDKTYLCDQRRLGSACAVFADSMSLIQPPGYPKRRNENLYDTRYWYEFGNIFPEMTTVWMALDKTTRSNSCMQVLKGSHKCGRIQHNAAGSLQAGADLSRVAALKERCPLVYCEMEPGDVLFLHCNTLHTSEPNDSDMRRWAFICCYNKASNNPYMKHHHPQYTPLQKVANAAIKECRNYTDFSGKEFTDPTRKSEDRKTFPPMLAAK